MGNLMRVETTGLKDVIIIHSFISEDVRGNFIKDYNTVFFESNTISFTINEVFYSSSFKGVMRGIHFQHIKPQAKLVRCIKGKIYDVLVDLRPESETYLKWEGFYLKENDGVELLVPRGFGHGYLVIEDSIVSYKCDEVFYAEGDSGIRWNDSTINIDWPYELIGGENHLIISEKDKKLKSYSELVGKLVWDK